MAAKLTKRAQSNNLLQPLTEAHFKTADLESIYRAIGARRDAYFSLYKINNNRKIKKFKFACRQKEKRAIDQIINFMTGKTDFLAFNKKKEMVEKLEVGKSRTKMLFL